jgi:hypothetical protein
MENLHRQLAIHTSMTTRAFVLISIDVAVTSMRLKRYSLHSTYLLRYNQPDFKT